MLNSTENSPKQGVMMVVLAMAVLGLIDNYVQVIADEVGVWQFHFIRTFFMVGPIVVAAFIFGWRLKPKNPRGLLIRSFFYSTALIIYFGSLGLLPISQVGAGMFTSPIFVLIISVLFLKTTVGMWRVLAVIIGFVGVLLIIKPKIGDLQMLTFLPVLGGVFYAIGNIATRRLCAEESTSTLMMGAFTGLGLWGLAGLVFFALFPALESGTFFTMGWVAPSATFWLWLMVQVVGSLIAVTFLTRGYQVADVTFAAVAEYSFLIFAGFWAFVLWGQSPDFQTVLGIVAIIISGVVIALRSR